MQYFLENICNHEWNIKQDAGRLIKDAEYELINKYPEHQKTLEYCTIRFISFLRLC